jgi:cytochrome P450/NADPH-cytochrome P450 reductase
VFRPERFLDGGFEALPCNAWKPFGNGRRACIGRAFAEQEMVMVAALILQGFQVEMEGPSYHLHLKSTLTVKLMDFKLRVHRRPGKDGMVGIPGAASSAAAKKATSAHNAIKGQGEAEGQFDHLVWF